MPVTHEQKVAAASAAIIEVFGDTSVTQAETRESLEGLIEEIRNLLDTIPEE